MLYDVIVLGESSEQKLVKFDETPAEADSEPPPLPEKRELSQGEEDEVNSEEVTKEEVGGTGEEAVPAEEEVIPTEEETVPAEEEAAPAEDEVSTGGEEAAPTEEEAIPSEEGVFTAEGEGGGEEEAAAPAEDEVSTGGEEAAPTEEETAPAEDEVSTGSEEAAPTEEAIPSEEGVFTAEGEGGGEEEEAAPAEDEVSTGGEEAAPTEEAAPAEEEAVPAEQEAALSEEEAVPAIEEAAPAKRPICRCAPSKKIKKKRTAPGGEEAAPTEEEFIQAEEEAAPTEEEAAPAEDEVSTGGEEAVPTEEEFIPAEEEAAPTEEEAAPAEDEVSTGGEEAAPTEEEFIQAEEEAAPAEEEAAPVEEETAPAEDEVSTGGEEAAPTEEEFIQAEEEAAPTEEEAAPAEDKVSTGGEEAAPTEEEFIPAEEEAAPAEEEFIPAEEEAAPSEEEAAPVEEEAVPSGEEAAPSEEGVASFEEPVVISEEGPEVLNEDEDEDLVFTDVSKECCCPEGQCVCCLAEGLESCRLSPIEKQYCIIPGDAEAPDVHEQSPSEPMIESRQLTLDEEELVEEKPQLTLDEVESVEEKPSLTLDEEESVEEKPQPTLDEEFVKEKPTEELPKVRTKCLCAKSRAAVIQPGAGDRPVPEETKEKTMKSAVQEPPKPDVSEENVQQILASAVDGTSKFSEERTKSIVADMLLDIAARVTAEHSVDNAEDLTRALEAELEQKEYCLTNEDIQKIMEDIIDSYTQEPCEKEALAGIIKKIVQDVVQNDAEASDEKERVAEDIQVILEGIMQLYSVGPMGEGEPEEAKPEVPVKVIQAPKPIAQVCSSKGDSLQSSTSELGCQVLCWDDSAFQPVVKKTSSTSSDMSCQVLCWNVQVGDEEARVPEPVVETDSDQPMDSEDKTEPLEEVDTDQTVGSEEQAEPAEEVDVEQTVDSEDKTEPVEEVDTDQTVDSEDKAEPVEEVDADQTIEAEEPIEKVDLDEPVDSDDKTEAVEEVGTDQAVDSEDKTEPVEEADKDQPVDSEPVEDVLPEAEETAPEDSQEMPLQEEISATESPSSDVVCEKPGEDEIKSGLDLPPDSESSEGCYCAPSDKMLAKDEVPSTEPSTSDAVCDKPAEGDKSEDLNDGLPPDSESSEGCYCIPSDKMFAKDEVPSSEPPTSDEVRDKPAEGDKNEDFKNKTFVTDAHRLERVSSSISQLAYEFPLQNEQPYRIEKVTSSIETCAFEFGSYKNTDNTPCIEGTDDTIGEVSSISPEGETEGGIDEMEEQEDDTNDIQETGDLSEEGSPAAPEVTAEDAEETEDGSEQVSPIDHEGSVDDIKETDGGEEVSPIISESGIDEPNEREGVSEEVVIAPEGGVDESKETPEETCPISSGGEQEIPEQNMVDENTANVQEQILESECKEDCDCTCITTRQEWKPNGDEIVEKPETTNEVIVDEKADGGIEEKSESIGKENFIRSDSVEELYKKESEFTEETPTIKSSPDDATISECGMEDTDLDGKESKEDFETDKRTESKKAFHEEEPMVQPGDSVEVMVVNHVGGEDEFIKDDSEKMDETDISYDGDTESEASDIEQSEDAQPKTDATDDFETVFKKDGIEDVDVICERESDYSPTSIEDDDSEYDTALSCPDHDELFTEESYPSDTEPTPKEEYMEEVEIDVVVEKGGGGGKPYSWNKGSVNFEGEILFSGMTPHETTSEDSAARVSIDSVLEADDEGQETANEVDQQVMFHYEGVRDILVGEVIPKESKGSVFIPATPSKVQHNPILEQIQPMTRVSQDNQEQGEPVKTSTSRDSKKRPSSGASKERVRESSIDRKRRWSKVKEEDSDLRVQINELNKRMAVKSKMLLDMEANLNALKGGAAPKGDQKLPLTKSAMAMVFAAIRDGLGALSCRCFMGGSPLPQPPCAPSSCDPLENSQPCPCASCCIPAQDIPPVFPCGIKCPFHMPPPPCNRWLLQRPPCCLPPGPGELVVRRVDHDSLLVRWGACRNPSVTGFDIYVNGSIVHRIRGTGRSIAMLTGLNLGGRTVICVYAMTPCGTYGNPMSTVYQPPSCVPCCKMRKNGNNDKYSLADEIGKNKTGVSEYRCL